MAASTFTGSLEFWHQGLPVDGSGVKDTTSGAKGYEYWHQGLPHTRNYGAAAPVDVPLIIVWGNAQARRRQEAVPYGSY